VGTNHLKNYKMAKLTKEELTVLSKKLAGEINAPRRSENNIIDKEAEKQFKATDVYKKMEEVREYFQDDPNGYSYLRVVNESIALKRYKKQQGIKKLPYVSSTEIYDELVIEQIGITDLQELINRVKQKFQQDENS
jgi:hypothetical protein